MNDVQSNSHVGKAISEANLSPVSPSVARLVQFKEFPKIEKKIENLKLDTQVYVVPHPAKVEKGGEDANFVTSDQKAIGVADGVGGWSMHGIDPAIYANSVMNDAKYAYENTELKLPLELLSYAYERAKTIQGSSTACILTLSGTTLRTANIGDSGFMIIRDGNIVYRSKEQLHSFNYPYQIGTASANVPEDANSISFEMKENDQIILGSDGLFDNLFDGEILEIVNTHGEAQVAEILAKSAFMKSQSLHLETPFRRTACELGLVDTPFGGKLDDITVVFSRLKNME